MKMKRALIATDVDRTILTQIEKQEKYDFNRGVGHELISLVENGFYVAFITGNSMEQLTGRLLGFLVGELCHSNRLGLLSDFHFFCNAGGVYFHFDKQNAKLEDLIKLSKQQQLSKKEVMNILTEYVTKDSLSVRPEFIDVGYLKKTCMPKKEVETIKEILHEQAEAYFSEINKKKVKLKKCYELTHPTIAENDGTLIAPFVEERPIHYMDNCSPQMDTVQLTLKPILSYHHGKETKKNENDLFEKDYRTALVQKIQRQLDEKGLVHYVARPGGRSSIDVTYAKLDKAYALEFIIDRLNLQGHERLGERFGSHTVYFGDEVIVGGGNDYPVTRIPGLLTFAVNRNYTKVPAISNVLVPSITIQEVGATKIVLRKLNDIAEELNNKHSALNVLAVFKEELFKKRIKEKLDTKANMKAHNWQTLNALVSLMFREDKSAKKWLDILVDELDSIMLHLGDRSHQSAYGTSHPDA